jgi:hypothetical protein
MEVDVEWDAEGSGQFVFGDTFTFDAVDVTGDFSEPIESELNLVCLRPQYEFFKFVITSVGLMSVSFNSTEIVRRKNGTEFYSTINGFFLLPPNLFQISANPNLAARQDAGNLTVQFLDYEITIPLYSNWQNGANPPPQGAFINCNVRVIADQYWPYDPEDGGGPIYDSVTGEQLRDFPS